MAVRSGTEISKTEIENFLASESDSNPIYGYLVGKKFDDNSQLPYYTASNADSVVSAAAFVPNSGPESPSKLLCKAASIKKTSSSPSLSAVSFDALSSIAVSAFIPITNLRAAEFSFYERQLDGGYLKKTVACNALLTDKAITGGYEEGCYANNLNEGASVLIDSADSFIERGGVADELHSLSVLASGSDCIQASVFDSLTSICLSAANHIRTSLSCKFVDKDSDPQDTATVSYHGYNGVTADATVTAYSEFSVPDYQDVFGSQPPASVAFNGWSLVQGSAVPTYAPGDEAMVTGDVSLWACFINRFTVKYHAGDGTEIADSALTSQSFDNGTAYKLSSVGAAGTSSTPLRFKNNSYAANFIGYSTAAAGSASYRAGASLTIYKSYDFWPKFSNKSLPQYALRSWTSASGTNKQTVTNLAVITVTNASIAAYAKVRFDFRCWINEINQTHDLSVVASAYQTSGTASAENRIMNGIVLFQYSSHNAPPGVSENPPSDWDKDSAPSGFKKVTSYFPLKNSGQQTLKILISVKETQKNLSSNSEGAIVLKNVELSF